MDARRGGWMKRRGGWMDVITVVIGRESKKRLAPIANPMVNPYGSN